LRNGIEDLVVNVKVEQEKGSKRVRTNFQIYDGFLASKVVLKHQDKIPIVKVEQVKHIYIYISQNPYLKDDVGIRVIKKLYS
jgi:hypothetical protein